MVVVSSGGILVSCRYDLHVFNCHIIVYSLLTLELKFCFMHLSVFKLNDLRHIGDRFLGYLLRISLFTAACPPLEKSRKGPVSPFCHERRNQHVVANCW